MFSLSPPNNVSLRGSNPFFRCKVLLVYENLSHVKKEADELLWNQLFLLKDLNNGYHYIHAQKKRLMRCARTRFVKSATINTHTAIRQDPGFLFDRDWLVMFDRHRPIFPFLNHTARVFSIPHSSTYIVRFLTPRVFFFSNESCWATCSFEHFTLVSTSARDWL